MKRFLYYFNIVFLFIALFNTSYAEESVTGFIPGQIWYSKEDIKEGESIKIYTALWNGSSNNITTSVSFYDNKVLIGSRNVSIEPSSLKDVYIIWKVTSGDHSISARIDSSAIVVIDGKKRQITLDNTSTTSLNNFIPVLIKKSDGSPNENVNNIKDSFSSIENKLSVPVSKSFSGLEDFRVNINKNILKEKKDTNIYIDTLSKNKTENKNQGNEEKPLDSTRKPIAYVKLFFLSVLSFIFSSRFVFYGLLIIILYFVFKFIFNKIKQR